MNNLIGQLVGLILSGKDFPATWGVLADAVEEEGGESEDWNQVYRELVEARQQKEPSSQYTTASRAEESAMRQMFKGLGGFSYRYAVNLYSTLFPADDVRHRVYPFYIKQAAIDGMNRAECGEDWEADLNRQRAEELLGEQGNLERRPLVYRELRPIEPEHGDGYSREHAEQAVRDGALLITDEVEGQDYITVTDERRHALWLDYPPEYLQSELEREHGLDAEFLTLIVHGGDGPEYLYVAGAGRHPHRHADLQEDEIWRLVATPNHTPEIECPAHDYDFINGEEGRDRKVILEETFCGESPGRECRYCQTAIGEEHGSLSIDDGGTESVYVRLGREEEEED